MSGTSGLLERNDYHHFKSRADTILVTTALLSNGLNIGMNVGLLGPTLPDLAMQTGSSIMDMNTVFIFSSIAYMAGSFACAFMVGRLEGYLLISLTLILQAVATAIAPWCTTLELVTFFISLSYLFSTVIISGTAYLCFQLERTRAQTLVQAVFLLFNLGKAVVPFLVAPFLLEEEAKPTPASWLHRFLPRRKANDQSHELHRHGLVHESGFIITNDSGIIEANSLHEESTWKMHSNVGYGYAIVAGYSLLTSCLYFAVAYRNGFHLWISAEEKERQKLRDLETESSPNISTATNRVRKVAVMLSFFFMISLQCGMESVDTGLTMSFFTVYMNRGKDIGIAASGLYQGVKVVVCVIVLFVVKYIHPSVLFLIDVIFMLAGSITMAATLQFNIADGFLWMSFILLAIGMSNAYATLTSWLETRYRISGVVTSILTVSFGLGSMVMPPLTTNLLDSYGPVMFPLVLLGCSILCLITYFPTKVLMVEGCCPNNNIRQSNSAYPSTETQFTVKEQGPLLQANNSLPSACAATYGTTHTLIAPSAPLLTTDEKR